MIQFDLIIIIASMALCFWKTSPVETEYIIRIILGLTGFLLSWFISAWSINGSVMEVTRMLLDSSLSLFFLILAGLMFLFVCFQALLYIYDRTTGAIESNDHDNSLNDTRDMRDTRDFADTDDFKDTRY
jgi:hypothetical protein